MKTYTVLLLRPDYVSDETLLSHVTALTPRLAIEVARARACIADNVHPDDGNDYACLLVIAGIHDDINPEFGQ